MYISDPLSPQTFIPLPEIYRILVVNLSPPLKSKRFHRQTLAPQKELPPLKCSVKKFLRPKEDTSHGLNNSTLTLDASRLVNAIKTCGTVTALYTSSKSTS